MSNVFICKENIRVMPVADGILCRKRWGFSSRSSRKKVEGGGGGFSQIVIIDVGIFIL